MKASLNTSQGVYIEFDDRKNYTTKNIYKYDMSFVNRYKLRNIIKFQFNFNSIQFNLNF